MKCLEDGLIIEHNELQTMMKTSRDNSHKTATFAEPSQWLNNVTANSATAAAAAAAGGRGRQQQVGQGRVTVMAGWGWGWGWGWGRVEGGVYSQRRETAAAGARKGMWEERRTCVQEECQVPLQSLLLPIWLQIVNGCFGAVVIYLKWCYNSISARVQTSLGTLFWEHELLNNKLAISRETANVRYILKVDCKL